MSVTSQFPDNPHKIFNQSLPRRRNNSGELDVFEAAGYFSGHNEGYGGSLFANKIFRDDGGRRGGRMSLDLPLKPNAVTLPPPPEKKHRQPSSPGGRLASFLNSLFSQASSKKKKKPKNAIKAEDESSGGGVRRRRSSLSTLTDSKSSFFYSSSSGFRTPPAGKNSTVETPTKNYKEIRGFLDQKRTVFSSKNAGNGGGNIPVRTRRSSGEGIGRINGGDEGAESDSSSDLFELRIYDLDCYSKSGLPVYETTNINQSVKRGL